MPTSSTNAGGSNNAIKILSKESSPSLLTSPGIYAWDSFLFLRVSVKSADYSSLRAVYIVIFCFPPNWSGGTFTGSFDLLLSTDAANGTIHYTLDGTHPIGPLPVAIAQAVFIVHHELGD